jgi:uncharacterized membrane protein YdcZ (DUF606 family)
VLVTPGSAVSIQQSSIRNVGDAFVWLGGSLTAAGSTINGNYSHAVATHLMVPRLGAATTLAFVIVGQLAESAVTDHFGLLGTARHPISLVRLAGMGLLLARVVLVRR